MRLTMECAALCTAAAQLMNMNSRYAKEICKLCAEVCERCAEECARHDNDHCMDCAEACRECAAECKRML